MKRLKLIVTSCLCLLLMNACKQRAKPVLICPILSENTYNHFGNWHNDLLTNANDNFKQGEGDFTYQEKIEYIKKFNQDHVDAMGLNATNTVLLKEEIEVSKELVAQYVAYDRIYVETDVLPNHDIYQVIEKLNTDYDIIDDFEEGVIDDILDLALDNRNDIIDAETFKEKLVALKASWVAQGYKKCDDYGRFSLIVLSISLSSVDWWLDNPNASVSRAAPWVALDAAGAIVGAASGAIISTTTNEFSWKATGMAAVGTGAVASTGLVGKIAEWLPF
ncbi:MAG: hypothetical protein AB8G15_20755 [Saprospiraceae bacterium]